MHDCHNCGGCNGCGNSLTLTLPEREMLHTLAQYPFLPIARKTDDTKPIYLEDDAHSAEEYALILQCLEKKGLISLDFDIPLKNADHGLYAPYPIVGSMALTLRGQQVLDLLDMQGVEE